MSDYPRLDYNGLLYYTRELANELNSKFATKTELPSDMVGADGSDAGAHGLVPAPGATDNTKFLRGDGTWAEVAGPNDMTGATDSTAGVHGLVPAPAAGDQNKFLRGDGSWAVAENTIDSISVNGTTQTPDVNKNVNIVVPTAVSDLTNDSNFQTATQVDTAITNAIASVHKPGGSVAFANLPALTAANLGFIYNVTDSFTTTANFVEGVGITYPAGTNVGIVNTGTNESPVYMYDVFGSYYDTSHFVLDTEMTTITNSEIDTIIATAFPAA